MHTAASISTEIPPPAFAPNPDMPDACTQEMIDYLDELRESGETNMYGARPYLLKDFPYLRQSEASKVLAYWMDTFGDRHPITEMVQ